MLIVVRHSQWWLKQWMDEVFLFDTGGIVVCTPPTRQKSKKKYRWPRSLISAIWVSKSRCFVWDQEVRWWLVGTIAEGRVHTRIPSMSMLKFLNVSRRGQDVSAKSRDDLPMLWVRLPAPDFRIWHQVAGRYYLIEIGTYTTHTHVLDGRNWSIHHLY